MTIAEAQEKYIGKRVIVAEGPNNPSAGGICTYIGPNEMLNWPLQITVDRMPLVIDSLDQVSLAPEPWSINK